MNISIIIPAYNEERNLNILLPELHGIVSPLCEKYEMIVVDSQKTTDNSEMACDKNSTKYIRQKGFGYADAFRCGIEESQFEAILIVDADNSQDISKIPEMFEELKNGCDVVIGSRYTNGGSTSDPLVSVIMSKLLNFTYRTLLGLKEKDISTDFRFYKKEMLRGINIECDNFDVIEETLFKLKKKHPDIKIKEIPTDYKPRTEGTSKRKLLSFIWGYIKLLIKLLRYRF